MADTAIERNALQDSNQFPSMTVVGGTAGTADTTGTSKIVRASGNPETGAIYVQDLSGASGTTNVILVGGTLNLGTVTPTDVGTNVQITDGAGTAEVANTGAGFGTANTVLYTAGLNLIHDPVGGNWQKWSSIRGVTDGTGFDFPAVGLVGQLDDTTPQTVTENQYAAVRINSARAIHIISTGGTIGSVVAVAQVHNAGTIQALPQVSVGTIPQVSVGTVPQISVGTLPTLNLTTGTVTTGSLANVAMLHAGTITTLPQISVGTLPTLNLTTGTITTGSLANVAMLHAGTISSVGNLVKGTITKVESGTLGEVTLVPTVTTVTNLTNGSVRMTVGTMTTGSLSDIAKVHNAGTLQAGTVQINSKPVTIGTPYHTRGTTGAAVWGTLIAASGAGTYQYVSNVDITVVSGTVDVAVTTIGVGGSTGAGVLARGQYVPSAGIAKQFNPHHRSGTNGTISYWLGGAGTVDINVTYWQAT